MDIKESLKIGISFGLTSASITTIGLMVGLVYGTNSRLAVIGGIITIAIADALSDALGIHISEEAEKTNTVREIWESTIATFITKFIFALTFLIPILLFPLHIAILICIGWSFLVVGTLSYYIGKQQDSPTWKVIAEHLTITFIVIIITYFLGIWINNTFK